MKETSDYLLTFLSKLIVLKKGFFPGMFMDKAREYFQEVN